MSGKLLHMGGDFTPEQQAFLDHDPGRSGRLVAGPGAGKSYTCVAYMEKHSGAKISIPARIRMLTFTRAAAKEFADTMREQGLGDSAPPPSTIHAFALSVLRQSKWAHVPQPVRIAGKWEEKNLIRPQLAALLKRNGHGGVTPGVVESLEKEMAAGFDSLDPNKLLLSDQDPALRDAYRGMWQQHRTRLGYLLLSELPYRAAQAIEDLGLPGLELDLLLVDEYQDLNKADIQLVSLAKQGGIAVIAIGDEDQSIYSWRHAAPQGIRDFPEVFGIAPEDDMRLSLSRRCGKMILDAAQTLIQQAPDRTKRPPMEPLDKNKAGEIAYIRFGGMAQEARGVAAIVKSRIRAGISASKIAVMARTKIDDWIRELTPAFADAGIAIASDQWVSAALSDAGLLRLRAKAQLAVDVNDSLSWMTMMHLQRGIGPTTVLRVYDAVQKDENFAQALQRIASSKEVESFKPTEIAKIRALVEDVMTSLPEFALPKSDGNEDLSEVLWGAWLLERGGGTLSEEAIRLLQLLDEKKPDGKKSSLASFLGELEPSGKEFALAEQDAVRFMTIQSSKGLTFNTAIVVGVEEGYVPYPRGEHEEERRLLYVAMTRATDLCILSFCGQRTGPLARSGSVNLGQRTRSSLLEGVLEPKAASRWFADHAIT